jgi:hypothetical protein
MTYNRSSSVFLAVLLAGSLSACRKQEPPPEPSVRLRVFTNGQELQNEAVKQHFIQQSTVSFVVPETAGPEDIIYQVTPDTVRFGSSPTRYSVVRNGEQHLFYSPVVRVGAPSASSIRSILSYTAPITSRPQTSGPAYYGQEIRVGYGDAHRMRLSVLHYRRKSGGPGLVPMESAGVFFNELNEAGIPQTVPGDTLAIQESSITVAVQ